MGLALEDVIDGRKEGRNNHDGDSGIVHSKKLEAEVVGVAAEEVANGAREETEHRAT